jgi:6-phosphogluconolactonase
MPKAKNPKGIPAGSRSSSPSHASLGKKKPVKASSHSTQGLFAPEKIIYATPETLSQETAHRFMQSAREAVNSRGRFVAALSGGTTPRGIFQQLAEEPYLSLVPWAKTFLFWVDERNVPPTHETSNYRMAKEYLLSKVPIPPENVFPVPIGSTGVEQNAFQYEKKLKKFFENSDLPRFDMSLMGMGEDGHTASLFPGMVQLNEREKWVVGYYVDEARKERISLTFPILNASRVLLVLVEGAKKAAIVKEVLEGPSDPPRYPIQYLRPTQGSLLFLMDAFAASQLTSKK